ncbi:sugar phosphate isomerase/epimerase family protein [Adhaeribacter aquaticus]|uniref:sugar phosphate isomerase/epimerase family protein n=1 Tax=Adhaeribacter aquaticus TaxID=299567 RepID=UPI000403F48B|nr:TIM barrel protein [Adhaeribacter aquaticus]
MDRRDFIQRASLGALALSFPSISAISGFSKESAMGIVVHSYGFRWNSKVDSKTYQGFANALDMLDHCNKIGAGGIQVVVNKWTPDFAKKVRTRKDKLGMYVEGSVGAPKNESDLARFEQDVKSAKEAGMQVLRSVVSSGRRYETYHSVQAFQDLKKNALASMQLAEPILSKYKMKFGLENHKDWRADEQAAMLKQIGSEWIGATIDFGNSISLLEDPFEVVQTLAPYAFSTHIKDMAVEEYEDGFLLSEVPLGKGILDLGKMVEVCKKHNPAITFNLEMITRDPLKIPCLKEEYWETFDEMKAKDLARTLRMVRQHKTTLPRVAQLSPEGKLEAEENNILASLNYSKSNLRLT